MKLIDGKKIAQQVCEEIASTVAKLKGPPPGVAFIQVGKNPASTTYVNQKHKVAHQLNIHSQIYQLPEEVKKVELLTLIDRLNTDPNTHGILIQAPLPSHLEERVIFNHINPNKDVDGFHTINIGKLCQEDPSGFIPCTPAGIIELMKRIPIATKGKHVVIVGRSLIVGKPVALLLLQRALGNATVTICHSFTENLPSITSQADVLIAATGSPHLITANMVKRESIVIDVGITRVKDPKRKNGYRLVGDVDFETVAPFVSQITPVPGGVGPMTVAMLMRNTLKAYQNQV